MDELIIRSLMHETTAEEERQLMRWRAASPENDARYRSLSATWELAGHAFAVPPREPPTASTIMARASRDPLPLDQPRRVRRGWRVGLGGGLVAAAGLAAAFLAGTLLRGPEAADVADAPYVIVAEQHRTAHLPDGSAVHLAAGSRLRVDPAQPRSAWLEGRAYFGIRHDPEHPFVVRSPAGETRVLGTRFDLTALPDELTLIVVEGRVEVISDAGEVEVGAGEQTRVVAGEAPVVDRADVRAVTDWLGTVFIFQSTPLEAVAAELEERFGRRVRVDDPALATRTVTAVFADRSLEEILPALCRAVEARCVTEPGQVRFAPSTHPRTPR